MNTGAPSIPQKFRPENWLEMAGKVMFCHINLRGDRNRVPNFSNRLSEGQLASGRTFSYFLILPFLITLMAARLAFSRVAPALANARATSSAGARKGLCAVRGYATADSENTVRHVATSSECQYVLKLCYR